MKIAFAGCRGVPALYGGFETAATEIGARLVDRGHEVVVYCRRGYGDEENGTHRGMQKVFLPRIRMRMVETFSHTFISLLHAFANPPDVLIVMNPANGPLLVLPWLRGTPFGVNVDGLDWERAKWPWFGKKFIYFGAWCCTKLAPALVADSRSIQDFYRERWGRDSHYASYGTYIVDDPGTGFLEESGLEPGKYLLAVARLEPENSLHLIIEAFNGVNTDLPLIIVGDDWYNSPYAQRLHHAAGPRVRFIGGVYDRTRLRQLMGHCYAYLHGHSVGGTNPILLKAMGCGAWVAYLDVNFNAEVVGDAGVPFPANVDGARKVLQEMVDHPGDMSAHRELGRNRMRQRYTWDLATDAYEQICSELLEGAAVANGVTK